MRALLLTMTILASDIAIGTVNPRTHAEQLRVDLSALETRRERAMEALDVLVRYAVHELRERDMDREADRVMGDWLYRERAFILDGAATKDIGDHRPIEWLYNLWALMDTTLGTTVMQLTHLNDLWVFAYGIPVVFSCIDDVDVDEYERHFIPFAGSTAYWTAQGVCFAATVGTAWGLICSPVSTVCELAVRAVVAPRLSPVCWEQACGS